MEGKKFEITGDVPKKKFEILSVRSENKRFEIETPKIEKTTLEWFKQENGNDCGPCLILNGLRRIDGIKHIPQDIAEVRREVNRLRRENERPELGLNDWFTSEDIGRYLSEVTGLNVEEFVCFADVAEQTSQSIKNSLEQQSFEMIYSTAGRHFRGIIPTKESNYQLIDSLNTMPIEQSAESINDMIGQSVYSASHDRVERIGIVRKGEAEYTVKSF